MGTIPLCSVIAERTFKKEKVATLQVKTKKGIYLIDDVTYDTYKQFVKKIESGIDLQTPLYFPVAQPPEEEFISFSLASLEEISIVSTWSLSATILWSIPKEKYA